MCQQQFRVLSPSVINIGRIFFDFFRGHHVEFCDIRGHHVVGSVDGGGVGAAELHGVGGEGAGAAARAMRRLG